MAVTSQIAQTSTRYRLDPEHGALRLVVFFAFIVGWLLGFLISTSLIANEGINLLAVLIGFVTAYLLSAITERVLKNRWHSGRAMEVDESGVKLLKQNTLEREIMSEDPANVLLWRFQVARRARVPKGWWMLACALEYERNYVCGYTFVSPAQMDSFAMAEQFKTLISTKKRRGAPAVEQQREDLRLAGEQRRLREAESHRWYEGGEMTPPDFMRYLDQLKTLFPEWFTSNSEQSV